VAPLRACSDGDKRGRARIVERAAIPRQTDRKQRADWDAGEGQA
jgi:hypothetical protein